MENGVDILAKLPIQVQYFIAAVLLLTTLGFSVPRILTWLLSLMVRRPMWSSMQTWTAMSNKNEGLADLPLHGSGRWCSGGNQEVNDYYEIDMQQERVITKIELDSRGERMPKKYKVEIARDKLPVMYEDRGDFSSHLVRFDNPQKFRHIKFTNIDPDILANLPKDTIHSWCIYGVRFYERRLGVVSWPIKVR